MARGSLRFQISVLMVVSILSATTLPLAAAKLKRSTARAWDEYVRVTEKRINQELNSSEAFLASEFIETEAARSCMELVRRGEICVLDMSESSEGGNVTVPSGRIHHWLGKVLVPGAKIEDLIGWVQNYDEHHQFYDDVEESRLISRDGNFFRIFLRLKRKKIITVHYNTNHNVHYYPQGSGKLYSSSIATRIREIEDAGTAAEKEKPEGNDNGFLWRLNSYWRYKETPEGVIVECESLSLSRDVPTLLFMIEGIVDSTAREALQYTLGNLRKGFLDGHSQ